MGIADRIITSGINLSTIQQTKPTGQRLTSYVPSNIVGQNLRHSHKRIPLSHISCWSHILYDSLYELLPYDIITFNKQLTKIYKSNIVNQNTNELKTILRCKFNNEHTAELSEAINPSDNDIHEYQYETSNYSADDYDIVIGCDGINSYVRQHELEHGRQIPFRDIDNSVYVSGVSKLQNIDDYWNSNHSHCIELWGNGIRLIHSYIDHTHVYWHLSLNTRYSHIIQNKQFILNEIIKHINPYFNQSIRQLIDCTDISTIQSGPLRDRVPSSRFSSDEYNICVVGNAQHMLTIDTYQSVAQCLEDSMCLALSLYDNDIRNAFKVYSQLRYPRLNYITNQSHSETTQAVSYNRFLSSIRDWATSLMPPNATHDSLNNILQYDINSKFNNRTFE